MKTILSIILLIVSLNSFTATAGDNTALRKKHFNLSKGIAIQQYDPVAYFTQNKAVKGSASFISNFQGATYYFSSAANKGLFDKNPTQYEPAYGGWCAYAMGKDASKVDIDPKTFKIENGRLFLFYNSWGINTLPKWEENHAKLFPSAEENWSKMYR